MANTYAITGNVSDFGVHSASRDAVRFSHLEIMTDDGVVDVRKPVVSKGIVSDVVSGERVTFHVARILGWNHIYKLETPEYVVDGSRPYRAANLSYALLSLMFSVVVATLLYEGFGNVTLPLIGMSVLCTWMSSRYPMR